jgi:hypothetical protein
LPGVANEFVKRLVADDTVSAPTIVSATHASATSRRWRSAKRVIVVMPGNVSSGGARVVGRADALRIPLGNHLGGQNRPGALRLEE